MRSVPLLVCAVSLATVSLAHAAETFQLKPTPQTIVWGYYDAAAKPALKIHSGDTVVIQTVSVTGPSRLAALGVPGDQIEQSLRDIYEQVKEKGPGGHILTGPVAIEEAQPGDTLEVRIQKIELALPYASNSFGPGRGFLPEDFPYAKSRIIPLDKNTMTAQFSENIKIPLHPFFGSMGVAPPPNVGRISSAPPWIHAGNLDNKDLVAGTTLYIPVHAPGALFEVGDGHANQGDGEVDITALETSLIGTFQFIVHKGQKMEWPRAETPTHYISMGIDEELVTATKFATREMIDFLQQKFGLSKDDAYMLTSVACDLHITQLVDGRKGVHAMIPKAIFLSPPK